MTEKRTDAPSLPIDADIYVDIREWRVYSDIESAKNHGCIESELRAYNKASASEIEPKLPEDVRDFIYSATLEIQRHRSTSEADKDALFQRAYKLYVKYDVEGERKRTEAEDYQSRGYE